MSTRRPPAPTGPLVLDLTSYLFDESCVEGVPQSTIDALVANAANYYIQIDSNDFPDGATRGQSQFEQPLIPISVASWLCPPDVSFPADAKTIAKECGGMALPGQSFVGPAGYTSTGVAGSYVFDDRIQGPGGFNEDLNDSSIDGAGSEPDDPFLHLWGGAVRVQH